MRSVVLEETHAMVAPPTAASPSSANPSCKQTPQWPCPNSYCRAEGHRARVECMGRGLVRSGGRRVAHRSQLHDRTHYKQHVAQHQDDAQLALSAEAHRILYGHVRIWDAADGADCLAVVRKR